MRIYELYFVLCLDSKGKIVIDKPVFYTGFVGAIIFDLLLAERATLTGSKLSIRQGRSQLDTVLEKALNKIEEQLSNKDSIELPTLINKMDPIVTELRQLVSQKLVDKKMIEIKRSGLFNRTRYVLVSPTVKNEIVAKIVQSVLNSSPTRHELMLVTLTEACELFPTMLPDRSTRKKFMNDLKAWKRSVSLSEIDEINISIKSIQPQLMVSVISASITSVISSTSVGAQP